MVSPVLDDRQRLKRMETWKPFALSWLKIVQEYSMAKSTELLLRNIQNIAGDKMNCYQIGSFFANHLPF